MTGSVTEGPMRSANRTRRRMLAVGGDPDADDASPPVCIFCGEDRMFTLNARDGHHVAGRVNDPDLTAVVCLNCHACQTEAHRRVGVRLRDDPVVPPTLLDRLAAMLAGAGVFLRELGDRLVEWADYLRRLVPILDWLVPGWREEIMSVPGPVGITVPMTVPPPPGPVPADTASELGVSEDGDPHDL